MDLFIYILGIKIPYFAVALKGQDGEAQGRAAFASDSNLSGQE
jgi:hypothetical protein